MNYSVCTIIGVLLFMVAAGSLGYYWGFEDGSNSVSDHED